MNRQEILSFVRSHPTSFLATVDHGEPRVRAMQTAYIDDEGLVFCTGVHKDVCTSCDRTPMSNSPIGARKKGFSFGCEAGWNRWIRLRSNSTS